MEYVMSLLIMLVLFFVYDIATVYEFYKRWIKNGETVKFIPEWKGTKKPFHWCLGWSIAKSVTDVIVFIVFVFMVPIDKPTWFILMPFMWCVTFFFQMIFYVICETIIVKRIRRKNIQPITEANAINDVIKNVDNNPIEDKDNGTA